MITRGFTARAIVTAHAALRAPSPEAKIWKRGREQQSRPVRGDCTLGVGRGLDREVAEACWAVATLDQMYLMSLGFLESSARELRQYAAERRRKGQCPATAAQLERSSSMSL
jgi:hypothetical protein